MEKTTSGFTVHLIGIFRLLSGLLESNTALYHPLNFSSLIFLVCSLSLSLSSFSFCFIAPFLVCTTMIIIIIILIVQYARSVQYNLAEREKKAGVSSARCRRASWSHAFSINQIREKMGQDHVCLRKSPITLFAKN